MFQLHWTFIFIFTLILIYFEFRKFVVQRKLKGFSLPKNIPFFGVGLRFFGKTNDEVLDIIDKFFTEVPQLPVQLWFGPLLLIGIGEPKDLQIILNSDHCLNKPYVYDQMMCTTSILATKKEIWRPHRRALNNSFNTKVLVSYVPILNEKSILLVNHLERFVGEPVNLYEMIFKSLMDIIAKTTMGVEMHLQSLRGEHLYNVAKFLLSNIQRRIVRFWLRWNFIYRLTKTHRDELWAMKSGMEFIKEIYDRKAFEINEMVENGYDPIEIGKESNKLNIIEKCFSMQREDKFTEENVLDQIHLMFVAGTDTSTIAIFSTILLLAIYQECQEKVVNELRDIFESVDSPVTYEHLSRMIYTERVIKEALRLFPPVPILARKCSADIQLDAGTIPNETNILVNILHVHKNEQIWGPNAKSFYPDHFLPENIAKRSPYCYLPFSGGARNCIGMKYAWLTLKIVLAHLLRSYKFTTDLKLEDIRTKVQIVLEITNENPVQLERRNF